MKQVKAGNTARLAPLFERHHRRLFGFFCRLTSDPAASEDLVQEVFMRMLRYRHTYSGEGPFKVWMFRIARNVQADHYRKREKSASADGLIDWEQLAGDRELPAEEDPAEIRRGLLRKAIARLDNDKRETLVLSRYEGLKYKEIAGILDCSVSAVKVRIYRAIHELKQLVEELQQEDAL